MYNGLSQIIASNQMESGYGLSIFCFQKRGSCNCECAPCGKENSGGCSDCCISLSETCDCDCCKPSTDSCLDSCCPKNKVRLTVSVLGTRYVLFIAFRGVQQLSGRVLDSRPRGRGLEPHRRRCVVSLYKTH